MISYRSVWTGLCLAVALVAAPAQAHYLWIDPTAPGAPVVRFGEFEEGAIEKSPGRLDEMAGTRASVAGTAVATSVAADHIALAGATGSQGVTAENLSVPVRDMRGSGLGMVKPLYYARQGSGGAVMALDILPAEGTTARVLFGGKPLPKAKVTVHAPNGWTREETADAEGIAHFSAPWRGLYVLEAVHADDTAGTEGGAAYDRRRHRATLSILRSTGEPTFAPVAHDHHH